MFKASAIARKGTIVVPCVAKGATGKGKGNPSSIILIGLRSTEAADTLESPENNKSAELATIIDKRILVSIFQLLKVVLIRSMKMGRV